MPIYFGLGVLQVFDRNGTMLTNAEMNSRNTALLIKSKLFIALTKSSSSTALSLSHGGSPGEVDFMDENGSVIYRYTMSLPQGDVEKVHFASGLVSYVQAIFANNEGELFQCCVE